MHRWCKKYIIEGSKYAHWIRLYLSFHLNWVLDPLVYGRLQNLQTSEGTFAHVITPLIVHHLHGNACRPSAGENDSALTWLQDLRFVMVW